MNTLGILTTVYFNIAAFTGHAAKKIKKPTGVCQASSS